MNQAKNNTSRYIILRSVSRLVAVLILVFVFAAQARSQTWKITRYEATFGIGPAHYLGEVGGVTPDENFLGIRDFKIAHTRPSFSFGFRYKTHERISAKLNMNFAWLGGNSDYGTNDSWGIKFSTFLFEPSLQGEFAIIKDKSSNNYLMMKSRGVNSFSSAISVYAFGGLGPAFYWPTVIESDDPRTDNYPDTHVAMSFPIGLGVKYGLTTKWKFSLELGRRFTTTDWLDSFTTEISKANDIYYFTTFNIAYVFRTSRSGWPTLW